MVNEEIPKAGIFFSEIFEEITPITKRRKYYYETCLLSGGIPTSSNPVMHRLYFKSVQEAIQHKQYMIRGNSKIGDSSVCFKKGIFEKDVIYVDSTGKPFDGTEEWANKLNDFFYYKRGKI